MLNLDLHIHSVKSKDSMVLPNKSIVKLLKKKGVHGISITDHNYFQTKNPFRSLMQENNLFFIPGIEIQTKNPKMGELLCLFIQDNLNLKQWDFFEIADEVREQDGIIILSHPFSVTRSNWLGSKQIVYKNSSYLTRYDGLEGINARNIVLNSNKYAIETANSLKKLCIGGSDAHMPFEIGEAFTCFKNLDPNSTSLEDIRKEMKANLKTIAPQRIKRSRLSNYLLNIGKKFLSGPIQFLPFIKRAIISKKDHSV